MLTIIFVTRLIDKAFQHNFKLGDDQNTSIFQTIYTGWWDSPNQISVTVAEIDLIHLLNIGIQTERSHSCEISCLWNDQKFYFK